LTLAQLRQRMDVSAAAITYLVDRMIDAGHIRREPDPEDRRKWLLRCEDRGMKLASDSLVPSVLICARPLPIWAITT
jgi:DNA-binding MarR family transcriptional regulator